MVMQTLQIRLTKGLIEEISKLVTRGIYPSTSECVRDAVRRLITGTGKMEVPEKEVKEVQEKVAKEVEKEIKDQFQKPKGTVDFYPKEMAVRKTIFRKLMACAERYSFKQIESPAFESFALLSKKEGEEIRQQIFTLEQKGKESFGLRFDLTVPAARMFIEKQKQLPKPVKWFYLSRMWRYEAPQRGRLREFYQFSAEIFGSSKPEADAEIISLAIDALKSTGLTEKEFFVKINNRKILEGLLLDVIDKSKMDDAMRIIDKRSKITEEEFDEELKKAGIKEIDKINKIISMKDIEEVKKLRLNEVGKEGLDELNSILKLLKNKKDFIRVDLSTARGLAYYTGTVFEIYDIDERYRALAGGGRYDKMIEMFKGQPTPATGFAVGYATLSLLLENKDLIPKVDLGPDYYIAIIGDAKEKAREIIEKLREKYKVEIDLSQRNLGNQLKYANAIGAKKVMFIGPDELKQGIVKVKDMASGNEGSMKIEELQ